MTRGRFWALISVAVALMVTAIALPFLMVVRWLRPNVALSFLSYAMSVAGLGISLYAFVHRSLVHARKRRAPGEGDRGDGGPHRSG